MDTAPKAGVSLNDAVTHMLEDDPETARSYLFYRWYSQWMEAIRGEREAQGFTQKDIASTLDTTQSSIARLENDRRGSITVRRLWEYAFAVGVSPLVEFRPTAGLMSFVKQHPDAQLSAKTFDDWSSLRVERLIPAVSAAHAHQTVPHALAMHNAVLGITESQWKFAATTLNSIAFESASMMEGLRSTFATLWRSTAGIRPTDGFNNVHLEKRSVPNPNPEVVDPTSGNSVDMRKLAA
jgi:transcriptional regulator with XRE-family HTH domain